ncbi:MAG: phosphoglycerate kinase [Planctomycetota bacterium]
MKKTVEDIDVRGLRVLVRLDLNVPLDDTRRITDDRRIREALPTIQRLIQGGSRLVLMSHLGRPEGGPNDKVNYSLAPIAKQLSELLSKNVRMAGDCVGPTISPLVNSLNDGDVCLLENLRFHDEETIADKKAKTDPALRDRKYAFARQLASLADVYVNDAFGTCHRDNASMLTVPQLMSGKPRVVGYLIQKELRFLGEAVKNPARPFVVLLGGAKVSDKLGVIRALLSKCDKVLVGGAMAYTFLAAEGVQVGKSLCEPDLFGVAKELRSFAGSRLLLPVDSIAATEIKKGAEAMTYDASIPANHMGLDIGPKTVADYSGELAKARTIVWNGPMGVFETPPFDRGTMAMAKAVAEATDRGATTIVGGGDSAAAIDAAGLAHRISHISTGGGASLEFLEGKSFDALDVLDDAP